MELVNDIGQFLVLAQESAGTGAGGHAEEEGGSFLVTPGLGLMIWTLLVFGFTMWVLSKVAFPRIQEALDKRAKMIAESIEAAERTKQESEKLIAEYRARLKEAREQADDIVARARKAAETSKAQAAEEGKEKREELLAAARRDIEAETRRSLERIRKEVADLTVLTTEKVTRKSLDSADQKRLVDEALAEVDFAALSPGTGRSGDRRGGDRSRIRRGPVRGGQEGGQARRDPGAARPVRRRAQREPRAAAVPVQPLLLLDGEEEGLAKAIDGAEPELVNFLGLLAEKHRMPVIFRIRDRFDDLWDEENKRLEVTVTSAVELIPSWCERIGKEIEKQTGQTVELQSQVDDDILGGLVLQVGNMVLDASVRNRLEKLRKSVAAAA